MYQRQGANRADAIVLDDEDPEEPDLIDLFDYHPTVKATPTTSLLFSDSPCSSATSSTLRTAQRIDVPSHDVVLNYGDRSRESVQSLTKPVVRHDKNQQTVDSTEPPTSTHRENSTYNDNQRDDTSAEVSRVRTAHAYPSPNGPTPALQPTGGKSPPRTQALNEQELLEILPESAKPQQKQDMVPSAAPQPAGKPSTDHADSSKGPKPKRLGTLAQRMNLAKLPAITNDNGKPMGFAALASAEIGLRYATPHAGRDGERSDPVGTSRRANRNSKTVPFVVQQGISITAFPPHSRPAKPGPKKAPAKKSDPPLPTFEMLKPNRKRPLSKIGAFELFAPSQVMSEAAFERRKRQRREKEPEVALTNSSGPKELQTGLGTRAVEFENASECDFEELPDVIEFGECDISGSRELGTNEVQDTMSTDPDEMLEMKDDGPIETPDSIDADPDRTPGKIESGFVDTPDNINGHATKLSGFCATEQALAEEVWETPNEVDLCRGNLGHEAGTEGLEPVGQQRIERERPTAAGGKKVHFDESAVITQSSVPKKQVTLDLGSVHDKAITTNETIHRYPESTLNGRPTKAGKGISEATLAAWQAAEDEDIPYTTPYHRTTDLDDELIIVTEPVYHYHVHRREWLTDDPEGEGNAEEQVLGPYQTLQEANTIAAREIRQPIQLGESSGISSSAWEYGFRQDHDGLQTQSAEAVGVHIEAEVRRGLAPPDDCLNFPASAFKITPRVYLVQELSWSSPPCPIPTTTPPTPALPLCETFTHACCTNLERANRKASEQWLAAYVGAWSDFGVEGKRKDAVEKGLKFDLKELKEGKECFHREVVFKDGGMCKIWVVEVDVEGPRN